MSNKGKLLTGAEAVVLACENSKADMMYGYPITPTSEVFNGWINNGNKYVQTEDEISAGFSVCGAVLAGQKAFTATAGPGHVLMQDGLSMAEGMRLPFVAIVGQRGGPSSGTVIYSQQEVLLACFGGNGEGMRIVFSPSNLKELYEMTLQAFECAWKYRFPTIVLTDGYLLKTKGVIDALEENQVVPSERIVADGANVHLPSIYTLEEELHEKLLKDKIDFDNMSPQIEQAELYQIDDADMVIIAHGIVGASAKQAINEARLKGLKVGLFRPMTLRPFPAQKMNQLLSKIKKVIFVESSMGQLERIARDQLDAKLSINITSCHFPGLGVEPEDILNLIS
ncbi:MAG: thiamine pyrophosphate-binding protein [bacterium]